ncbi:bifunctional hydroxymethylpyrimidine kinase/phosphomethylpyrimidine kinase [Duganella qianjiadongensis]|uniref:hydroxymethylpyrimidine kinase n=1 Tax=Duganella qianjiadongensis TaxID=2692176 RepID=A0ABW9VGZ1_9BURK|nr:hydroxymethylpyrimidine/phosphomethylpyrimidine kinase [Duganella qianjiadongensis]MYM38894.1 hydroxymethylpyrimidine/phosphomethylpyrimidine kinase [Duganella qianjiadongensis]
MSPSPRPSPRLDSRRPCVLVFAGFDPSGGAGLSADLQAIAGQGAHALTVVTALTVQDNDRVRSVHPVAAELLRQQAQALIAKFAISAVKIGITGSAENAQAIAELIVQLRRDQPQLAVVLDPVLASGHGDLLSRDDAVQALAPLLPLATVLTPNEPEAQALTGQSSVAAQMQRLHQQGCQHVLLTGGHSDGEVVLNRWFGPQAQPDALREWRWLRLAGGFHGSGCTLASALAGQLAMQVPLALALDAAQAYCHAALSGAYAIGSGQRIPARSTYF